MSYVCQLVRCMVSGESWSRISWRACSIITCMVLGYLSAQDSDHCSILCHSAEEASIVSAMGIPCDAVCGCGSCTAGSHVHSEPAPEPVHWGCGCVLLMFIIRICRCVCGDDAEAVQGVVMAEECAAGSVWSTISSPRNADEGLGGSDDTRVL